MKHSHLLSRVNPGRIKKPRTYMTLPKQQAIVLLRYGNLEDFSRPVLAVSKIADALRFPYNTVHGVLTRFVRNNYEFKLQRCNGPKQRVIPDGVLRFLKCNRTLERQAQLSIQQRCQEVQRRFNFRIAPTKLVALYKDWGIFYRKPKLVDFRLKRDAVRIGRERIVFAERLQKLIAEKKEIVYVDETTFHTWMRKARVWQKRKNPIELPTHKRVGTCTLFGAISTTMDPVYMTAASTSKRTFEEFLRKVIASLNL